MTESSVGHYGGLEAVIEDHGFFSWLNLDIERIEHGRIVLRVPYDEKFTNRVPGDSSEKANVHGGIAATLVDTASGFALRSTFDDPENARLTTTDLNVSYLRPATDDLTVEADVIRAGGSMGVTEATVSTVAPDGDEKDVAVGRTSYRLFRDGR